MPISAFGSAATMSWAATLPSESSMVVTDPSGFGGAFGELVSRGLNGQPRDLFVLPESPRNRVLEMAFSALKQRSNSHDALLRALDQLAECKLSLNGQTQAQFEQSLLGQAVAFQDLTLLADRTFFRSFHDLELATQQYGYRPLRSHVFMPLDEAVPPSDGTLQNAGFIAVWSCGAPAGMLEAFRAACFDVRMPIKILASPAGAARGAAGCRCDCRTHRKSGKRVRARALRKTALLAGLRRRRDR